MAKKCPFYRRRNTKDPDKFFPPCPIFKRGRCSRLEEGVALCPLKDYERELPPIQKLSGGVCRYRKRKWGRNSKLPLLCIFYRDYVCGLETAKKSASCPLLQVEACLNAKRDQLIGEIYGEVDSWIARKIEREMQWTK